MARKKRHEEHENHERWLVSYADLVTLLFAFFVVMYAISTQDKEKAEKAEASIRSSLKLGGVSGGHNLFNKGAGAINNPLGDFPTEGSPIDMMNYYLGKIEQSLSQAEQESLIQDISADEAGTRIKLRGSNLFLPGQVELNPQALEGLGKLSTILKASHRRIIVEGHTDNTPLGSETTTNWELGALRATNVLRYMLNEFEIQPHNLSATSYADTQPIAPNTTPEGRAKNRRIELLIAPGKKLK